MTARCIAMIRREISCLRTRPTSLLPSSSSHLLECWQGAASRLTRVSRDLAAAAVPRGNARRPNCEGGCHTATTGGARAGVVGPACVWLRPGMEVYKPSGAAGAALPGGGAEAPAAGKECDPWRLPSRAARALREADRQALGVRVQPLDSPVLGAWAISPASRAAASLELQVHGGQLVRVGMRGGRRRRGEREDRVRGLVVVPAARSAGRGTAGNAQPAATSAPERTGERARAVVVRLHRQRARVRVRTAAHVHRLPDRDGCRVVCTAQPCAVGSCCRCRARAQRASSGKTARSRRGVLGSRGRRGWRAERPGARAHLHRAGQRARESAEGATKRRWTRRWRESVLDAAALERSGEIAGHGVGARRFEPRAEGLCLRGAQRRLDGREHARRRRLLSRRQLTLKLPYARVHHHHLLMHLVHVLLVPQARGACRFRFASQSLVACRFAVALAN
mmetsp:Transcript_23967/g.61790  ORF Transcript_23967/g.61790 Transcript_23967/m.61790 type:complete len:451 (+) Transcript_23967:194-1546(+)